jgi:hypothetical protein
VDVHQQIARRSAHAARVALAGNAQGHAVLDACRDANLDFFGLLDRTTTIAALARRLDRRAACFPKVQRA